MILSAFSKMIFLKKPQEKKRNIVPAIYKKSSYLAPLWTNFNVSICVRIARTWSTTLLKTPSQGYIVRIPLRNSFYEIDLQSIFFFTVPHRRKFLEIFPTSFMVDDPYKLITFRLPH